jgi:signal peptidase I
LLAGRQRLRWARMRGEPPMARAVLPLTAPPGFGRCERLDLQRRVEVRAMSRRDVIRLLRRMPRTAVLALALFGVLVGGCGSGDSASAKAATGGSMGGTRALAYARAVNLRAANLPGLFAYNPPRRRSMNSEAECGRPAGGEVFTSASFENRRFGDQRHPIYFVSSSVLITKSPALAAEDVAAASTASARACLKRHLEADEGRVVGSPGPVEQPPPPKGSVSLLPAPLQGLPLFAIRTRICRSPGPPSPPCKPGRAETIEDRFGFAVGSAVISLDLSGYPRPFPPRTARYLLPLLYSRAAGQKLYRVPSGAMEPTLSIGQRFPIAPLMSAPQIGDIVVFHPPQNAVLERCGAPRPAGAACAQSEAAEAKVVFVKRIVAGPGDVISIVGGHVIRNGIREADSYIKPCAGPSLQCNFPTPIKIPAGNWFLLGDNRGESDDSRFWGPVPTSWIVGSVGIY